MVDHPEPQLVRGPASSRHARSVPACRAMLVSASAAMRYAATSTAGGSGAAVEVGPHVRVRCPGGAARSVSAPTRPSSSRLGGRSSRVTRRTPSRASRAADSRRPSRSRAVPGSSSTTSRRSPSCMDRPASVGPSSSCRSRRSRERSSSRAVTICCRLAASSSVRRATATRGSRAAPYSARSSSCWRRPRRGSRASAATPVDQTDAERRQLSAEGAGPRDGGQVDQRRSAP